MARNTDLPRPGRRTRPEPAPRAAVSAVDVATVYAWLCRFTENPAECERLLVDVLRRFRASPPAFLRTASPSTYLQYLTVESVLRLRGVL
jgi:hypothetical protein